MSVLIDAKSPFYNIQFEKLELDPESLKDPIFDDYLTQAYTDPCGHTLNKRTFLAWKKCCEDAKQDFTCPFSREVITMESLRKNYLVCREAQHNKAVEDLTFSAQRVRSLHDENARLRDSFRRAIGEFNVYADKLEAAYLIKDKQLEIARKRIKNVLEAGFFSRLAAAAPCVGNGFILRRNITAEERRFEGLEAAAPARPQYVPPREERAEGQPEEGDLGEAKG